MVKRAIRTLSSGALLGAALGAPLFLLQGCGDSAAPPNEGRFVASPAEEGAQQGDAGAAPEAPPPPKPATISFIHGAVDFGLASISGRVRLCFAKAGGEAASEFLAMAPWPETSGGIAPGHALPSFSLPEAVASTGVEVMVLSVDRLAEKKLPATTTCESLLGTSGAGDAGAGSTLRENVDYWKLPALEPGTLADAKHHVVGLTGCVQNNLQELKKASCGADFDDTKRTQGPGNLALHVFEVDDTPVADGAIGVQFVHLSPSFGQEAPGKNLIPELVPPTGQGSAIGLVDENVKLNVGAKALSSRVDVKASFADTNRVRPVAGTPAAFQTLVRDMRAQSGDIALEAGKAYTFAWVGVNLPFYEPASGAIVPNGFHVVVVPNAAP